MFKRIKFLLTFFLLFLCVFGLVSCEKEEIPAPKAEALLAHYSGKTVRPWIELDEEDDCFPPAEVPYFITYNYDNSSPGVTTFILQVNENPGYIGLPVTVYDWEATIAYFTSSSLSLPPYTINSSSDQLENQCSSFCISLDCNNCLYCFLWQ